MQTVRACCRSFAAIGAALLSFSLHAAPGGNWNTIEHTAYPTPQNVMAALDGSKVKLAWDGVAWPADGWATEIEGKTVPTDFTYGVECRVKDTGTDKWSDWWTRTSRGRLDDNGAFVSRWEIEDEVESGKTYQYRIRCYSYIQPENPHLLTNPTQDGYFSDYSDVVTAYKTLDKLELTLVEHPDPSPLRGAASFVEVEYKYDSSRAAEGEEPLYFTFTALEIPYPAPGTVPEAPAAGSKPYARRDGTPLAVTNLWVCPPNIAEKVDPTNFTLAASSDIEEGDSRSMTWYANNDLKNYYHTNVTIWVQGWAQPETAGGKPRLVVDEAIGDVTIDTRCLTAGPNPEQDGVLLTWPSDPRVAKYEIWRLVDVGDDYLLGTVTGTSYTDTAVSAGMAYHYEVKAFDSVGKEIDSAYASGYSRLDAFSTRDQSLYFVQPQTPWNGKVDIVVRYYSARVERNDGIPHFKLIAENFESGESLTVKTLTRADGEVINPDDFTLEDEQNLEQRLVWDAGADLGETLVERLRLTVDCVRVEPYYEGDPVTAWTGSPAKYKENVRLDTRNPRIRKLGQGTHAWVDLDWFPGATKADLYCNGTLIHTTTDEYTRKKTLDNAELNIWGTNELKVVTDTGVTWTGGIAYPSFGFTVSEGNEDGITLTWNTVDDEAVGGYQVRRRVKGSTDDFETVATVGPDVTTYTDKTADEAGAYEYTVVPRRTWDADIGPVPAAKRGYRSLDKVAITQARQLYPWTTQVALDISYVSGREEATDGAVTYRLEAELADGTSIPLRFEDKTLRLETVDGFSLDPADILFGSPSLPSGKTTRLWWNAPKDLGQVQVSDSVVEGIVLRIVPTLADDAPAGAVAAPAPAVKDGLTVDLRTVRPVTVGEKIPVVWEWMRTDPRDETRDYTVILAYPQGARECVALMPEERTGEGEVEVTENMWTCFNLVKRELNDGADDAQKIELTSEVLFQLPVEPVANVQATRGNADALTVTWDPVPYASRYQLDIATCNAQGATGVTRTQYVFDGTRYVDTRVPEVGLVSYVVRACYPNRATGEPSAPVVGWRTLDKAELTNVSTRRPWDGTVDIDLTYQTARDQYGKVVDGAAALPGKTVTVAVTTAQGEEVAVQSLVRETLDGDIIRREKVTNGAFTLGANDRIIWDAPADAPVGMYEPGATLKVTIKGDEYSNEMRFEKSFDLDTRTGVIDLPFGAEDIRLPWSTRWAKPEVKEGYLGSVLENAAWWKQTAVLTDITDSANPVEILRTEAKLGEGGTVTSWTPKSWGENKLTLTLAPASGGDEPMPYSAVFKMPDFGFTATTNDADGVTLKWNALAGAASYEIRRRKVGTSDAFEEITNVVDVTTWTDDSVETVVGDFEYQVVPRTAGGSAGPDLAPVSGTRGAPQTVLNVVATQGDTNAVTVTWDAVPHASAYEVKVERWDVAINRTTRTVETNEACFVDAELPQPGLGRYTVTAVYPNGMKGAAAEAAVGYAVLDVLEIRGVKPRFPWNGLMDIDVVYRSVRGLRDLLGEGTPRFTLAADCGGETLSMQTLYVADGTTPLGASGFNLADDGSTQRLVWDARADLGETNLLASVRFTLSCSGVEASGGTSATPFTGEAASAALGSLDTRRVPEIVLGQDTSVYIDLDWFAGATKADLSVNGTKVLTKTDGGTTWKSAASGPAAAVEAATANADSGIRNEDSDVPDVQAKTLGIADEALAVASAPNARHANGAFDLYLSPDGDDAADGLSSETAKRTLAGVVVAANATGRANLVVAVCEGDYEPPYADFGATNAISFRAVGDKARTRVVGGTNAVCALSSASCAWQGFTFTGFAGKGYGERNPAYAPICRFGGMTFRDCDFEGNDFVVDYGYAAYNSCRFSACTFDGNTYRIIQDSPNNVSKGILYRSCAFDGCSVEGVTLKGAVHGNGDYDDALENTTYHILMWDIDAENTLFRLPGSMHANNRRYRYRNVTLIAPSAWCVPPKSTSYRTPFPTDAAYVTNCLYVIGDAKPGSSSAYILAGTNTAEVPRSAKGVYVALDGSASLTAEGVAADMGCPSVRADGEPDYGWKSSGLGAAKTALAQTGVFLSEEQLNIWGTNTLTLVTDTGTTWTGFLKYPDFAFSATADNEDGVTLTWNALDGAASYEIRRRKAGETDYEIVTNVTDAVSWTDDSVDTVVGDFEYVVVPISKTGTTLPAKAPARGTRGAPQTVQNVVASQGDTNAVTVTWDAVPHASAYEVKVERWDVAINRTTRTVETNEACFVDTELPQPGLGRYTVTAVYPNGMKGAPSEAVVGYAVLDTMKIQGVSTRWPWNGKVDLDVEYKTVRTRFNELFGLPNLPYPTNVTLAAQTAEGASITVATLDREPAVDRNYTVNRKAVENGTAIFSGSGWLRLVWDADTDTQNSLLAPGTTLTLTVADDYSALTDSCTVDIDTTKPLAIPLPEESEENDRAIAFPWAARWADEADPSLNMQDGTDLEIVTVTRYGTVTNVVKTQTQLSDEGGVYTWRPGNYYGVLIVEATFTNRATAASSTYRSKFLRSVATPVTVERVPGQNALDIKWTFSADCTYYQIIRREVYADGTRSPWQNMAPLSGPWYRDIGVVGGRTYEYAACPMYSDPDTHNYITAEPVVWTAGSVGINAVFDAMGPWLENGQTVVTQFVDTVYAPLPTATRAGYRLVGWTLGVTNGAPEAVADSNLLVRANHTLYARWETDWNGEAAFAYEPIDATTARITGLKDAAPDNGCFVLPDRIDGYLVTEIGARAFYNATADLGTVTLPVFCTNVADYAFCGATKLTGLAFVSPRNAANPSEPATLSLGAFAFATTGLTDVTVPASVGHLGSGAFGNCAQLADVTVLGTPTTGGRDVFRRAASATAEKKLTLRADAAWIAANGFGAQGNIVPAAVAPSVRSVRVTGLSGAAKAWTLTLAVTLADGDWDAFDAGTVRVDFAETLGATPTRLVPTKAEKPSEGVVTVTVELSAESPSGFFRVVVGE